MIASRCSKVPLKSRKKMQRFAKNCTREYSKMAGKISVETTGVNSRAKEALGLMKRLKILAQEFNTSSCIMTVILSLFPRNFL